MKTGIELIAEERQEQILKHGRTIAWDVNNNDRQQLRKVAKRLLIKANGSISNEEKRREMPQGWNDQKVYDNMMSKSYKDRLVIAAALIAAEIDRIQNLSL